MLQPVRSCSPFRSGIAFPLPLHYLLPVQPMPARRSHFLRSSLLAATLTLASGCSHSSPLPPGDERLMQAYIDLLQYRDALRQPGADTTEAYRSAVDSLLGARGFTQEEFRLQFRALPRDEGRFRQFMEAAEQELRRRRSPPPESR